MLAFIFWCYFIFFTLNEKRERKTFFLFAASFTHILFIFKFETHRNQSNEFFAFRCECYSVTSSFTLLTIWYAQQSKLAISREMTIIFNIIITLVSVVCVYALRTHTFSIYLLESSMWHCLIYFAHIFYRHALFVLAKSFGRIATVCAHVYMCAS